MFLKIHTDAGFIGLGEPITEGRALTQTYIEEAQAALKAGNFILARSRANLADSSSRMDDKLIEWQQALLRRDAKAISGIYTAQFATVEKQLEAMATALRPTVNAPTLAGRLAGFHSYLQYWEPRAQLLAAVAGRAEIGKQQQALKDALAAKPRPSEAELTRMSDAITNIMRETTARLTLLEGHVRAVADLSSIHEDESPLPATDQANLNRRLAERLVLHVQLDDQQRH